MMVLNSFINGAVTMGSFVIALYFLKVWTQNRERLFAIFSLSFCLMAVERIVLELTSPNNEFRPFIYLIRLLAFVLIIGGVVDRNRRSSQDQRNIIAA